MKTLIRPYNFLSLFAVVLVIVSFFSTAAIVDIHAHDTYYVIYYEYLFWLVAFAVSLLALLYRITDNVLLSKYFTWVHIIITLSAFLTVLVTARGVARAPEKLTRIPDTAYLDRWLFIDTLIAWMVRLFVLVQVLFIANVISGIARKVVVRLKIWRKV